MAMKAIMKCVKDVDPGASADEFTLLMEAVFVGSDVPGGVMNAMGEAGNGVPVALNITQLAQYANRIEDALIAEAVRLGLPPLLRTDVLFINYQRGA